MKQLPVYFILPPHTLLLDVAGPAEALEMANRYQNDVRFEMRFCGPDREVASSIGLTLARISPLPKTLPSEAMIVVSGAANAPGDQKAERGRNKIVDWLRAMDLRGKHLVFICTGALLAGRAGLLDNRECTTHHSDCEELQEIAPAARVLDDRIYVADGNVYTSAGVTAGVDLMLHLIAEIAGPLCAVATARNMVVYMRRAGADPQVSPWLASRNHIHPAVHRVQDAIAANPAHPWTLRELARLANASPRHLARLFHMHTHTTPVSYLNALRVAVVRQLLANSQLPIDRVAEKAGFGSDRHLRRIWRRYSSVPLSIWRKQQI